MSIIIKTQSLPFRLTSFSALCAVLLLAGCGDDQSPKTILQLLQNGKYAKALSATADPLAANPKDLLFNTLALQAAFESCLAQNCFEEEEHSLFAQMKRYQQYTTAPVRIEEQEVSLKVTADQAAPTLFQNNVEPQTLVNAMGALPPYARSPLTIAISQHIQTALLKKDMETALKWLLPLTRDNVFSKDTRHLSSYIYGLLTNTHTFAKANLVALKARRAKDLTPETWALLPLGWWLSATTEKDFFSTYDTEIKGLISFFSNDDKRALAQTLSVLAIQNPNMNIGLMTRQIALYPESLIAWEAYIPALKAHLSQMPSDAFLLEFIDPLVVPESIRDAYNTMIFELTPLFKQQNQDPLPLLEKVALQGISKPSLIQLEKLVKSGLEDALARTNVPLVLKYAQFRPSVAKENRHQIMPVMLDETQRDFDNNRFDNILKINTFLTKNLGVDFDLNALLFNAFQDYLIKEKVSDKLSASHPEWLLKNEPFDLGPKFTFLQSQFKDKPETLNNILKDLVSTSQGIYGTPTAFYRLMPYFNKEIFSQETQEDYLKAAIQFSLENDIDLSGAAFAGIGYKLHQKHNISLNFIATKALDRTDNLEEERLLWSGAPSDMKASWQTDQPAFHTLMTAIDLFDAGQKAEAARFFGRLSNEYYLKQAKPYLDHYAITVDKALGWYVPTDSTETNLAFIGIAPQSLNVEMQLTSLQVALINKAGSLSYYNRDTVATNHAAIYKAKIEGALNFDNNTISFDDTTKDNVILPEPFSTTFGDVTTLKMLNASYLNVFFKDKENPVRFKRIQPKAGTPLFPQGTFTITQAKEDQLNKAETILPEGSKITLNTQSEAPVQFTQNGQTLPGIIFPIQGSLVHPAAPEKTFPIQGYYSPGKHIIQLTFDYPLNSLGRQATAATRCQQQGDKIRCLSHHAHNNKHQYTAESIGTKTKKN